AYDASVQPITDYVGPVSFTSSDPRAVLPSDDGTGWSNGAKDFVLTFRSLGEQTYTVHDITVSQSSDNITVTLGPLGGFTLTAPSLQQAGVPFSVTLSAYDIADNLKTDYTGVVSFTSSDPQAVLPSDDGTGWSEGAKDFEFELRTTGPQTYTAHDGLVEQVSTAITVTPGALNHFALTAPSPQQAGVPFSVTVTAYDDFDNLKTDYSGVVSITSSDPLAVLPTDDGTGWSEGAKDLAIEFRTIGTQTYSVQDGAVSRTSSGISVNPGPLGSFALTAPSPQQAGVPFSVTVTAYDVVGNPKTDYSGVVSFASSDPQAVLPTDDGSGWSQGVKDLTLELRTTGVQTYSAQDGAVLQTSDGITVTPGALGSFALNAPSPQQAGIPFSVTVTAYDIAGNIKTDYAGPVTLASSDAQAVLPTDSGGTGPSSWLDGAKDFTLELRTAGAQTYTAQDGDVEQTSDAITVNPGPLALILIRDAADGGGSQVISHTMGVNDSLTVYAAGYDTYDNFTSDIVVTWSTTGDLDAISAGPAISATFAPTTADTSGTISADDGQGHVAATGVITVTGSTQYLVFIPLVTK
ncbi:MAG: hypothetical protein PVF45_14615, partial [Anaerolineae bacterium]